MIDHVEAEDESANWTTTERTVNSDSVFRQKAAPFGITRADLKKKRLSAHRFFALYETIFEPLKQKYAWQPSLLEADPTRRAHDSPRVGERRSQCRPPPAHAARRAHHRLRPGRIQRHG